MKNTRKLVITALFSALAYILMLLDFAVPFIIPGFIKFDFAEIPALICAFVAGPIWGAAVCLIKNAIHLLQTSTVGAGELSNFLLGVCFVVPAGIIYKKNKTRLGALIGCIVGALVSAGLSYFINLYITYPVYMQLFMPEEAILNAYRALLPQTKNLSQAILIFNVPFNAVKYSIDALITFAVYKHLSPILKGKKAQGK
ncbi:MAG: ECF transporter S component [Clostridia bacterium]|nr:ECF transporter S component [Clostridia bacterium]